jgi:protein-L-isoaspartate(D-aspartate) O-methyltransferase
MAQQSRVTGIVLVVVLGVAFLGGVVILALVKPDVFGLLARPAVAVDPAPATPVEPSAEPAAAATAAATDTPASAPAKDAPAAPKPVYDITARTSHPPLRDREAYVRWSVETYQEDEKYARLRFDRAEAAVAREDIRNDRVLEAFLRTPRHEFCRPRNIAGAYEDAVLDLGYGQTMSGPHLQSRMTSFLDVQPQHHVLEIGTGSGNQSAYLSELSNFVYTIEIVPQLATETDQIYSSLYSRYPEYQNIKRMENDGYYGWPEYAPFDRIIVTCGIDHIPPDLLKQLTVGGIMVIPVGPPGGQTVMKVTKKLDEAGNVVLEREDIYAGKRKVMFVPFTAKGGGLHSTGGKATEGQ